MPLNINFQQVFLHMLNFVLLFGAMYFLLYKPVKNFMDAREEKYRERDRISDEMLEKAEASKAEYEQKLAAANAEIEAKKAQAQEELAKELDAQRAEAQKTADAIVEKGRKAAMSEREKLLRKAEGEISEMVSLAAEKLVLQSTSEAYEQFLATAEERSENA